MSATASFFLIETSRLNELEENAAVIIKKRFLSKKVTDNYWDYLANNTTSLETINGSGYIYGNLLTFLEEVKGIDLTQNEYDVIVKNLIDKRGNPHFLFTNKQKNQFLNKLQISNFSLKEFQDFNQEFSEEADEATAELSIEALKVLHDNLSKIQSDAETLLLVVG